MIKWHPMSANSLSPQHPNRRRAEIRTHVERMCRAGSKRSDIYSYINQEMAGPSQLNNNWGLRTEADFFLSQSRLDRDLRWLQEPGGTIIDFNERIGPREMVDIDVTASKKNKIPRLHEYEDDVVIAFRTPGTTWNNGGWGEFTEQTVGEIRTSTDYVGYRIRTLLARRDKSVTNFIKRWFNESIFETFGVEIQLPSIEFEDLIERLSPLRDNPRLGMEIVGVSGAFPLDSMTYNYSYDHHDIDIYVRGIIRSSSGSLCSSWASVMTIDCPPTFNEETTPSRTPEDLIHRMTAQIECTYPMTCIGIRTVHSEDYFDQRTTDIESCAVDEFHINPRLSPFYEFSEIDSIYELASWSY